MKSYDAKNIGKHNFYPNSLFSLLKMVEPEMCKVYDVSSLCQSGPRYYVAPAMPQDLRTTPFKMFVLAQESELNLQNVCLFRN